MVRGFSAEAFGASSANAIGASVAALAAIKNRNPKPNLRISLLPSVRQTEFDSNASRVIHRLALAQGRLEFDLLCGLCGGLVASVSQTANDAVHLNVAADQEDHFQHHVAFQFHATPFSGVLRPGLVQDGNSGICGALVAGLFLRRLRNNRCVAETSSSYVAALAAAGRRIRCAISESSAGHRSANSLVAA